MVCSVPPPSTALRSRSVAWIQGAIGHHLIAIEIPLDHIVEDSPSALPKTHQQATGRIVLLGPSELAQQLVNLGVRCRAAVDTRLGGRRPRCSRRGPAATASQTLIRAPVGRLPCPREKPSSLVRASTRRTASSARQRWGSASVDGPQRRRRSATPRRSPARCLSSSTARRSRSAAAIRARQARRLAAESVPLRRAPCSSLAPTVATDPRGAARSGSSCLGPRELVEQLDRAAPPSRRHQQPGRPSHPASSGCTPPRSLALDPNGPSPQAGSRHSTRLAASGTVAARSGGNVLEAYFLARRKLQI